MGSGENPDRRREFRPAGDGRAGGSDRCAMEALHVADESADGGVEGAVGGHGGAQVEGGSAAGGAIDRVPINDLCKLSSWRISGEV